MSARTIAVSVLLFCCLGASLATPAFEPYVVRDPDSPTMHKHECESCFNHEQCLSGVCYRRKCVVDLSRESTDVCFQEECSPCQTRLTCSSNRCKDSSIGNKCIKNTNSSLHKCFPGVFPMGYSLEELDAEPAPTQAL